MKTYVSYIKGHTYLYAYDSIFIAHGKSVQKTKLLGRIDNLAAVTDKKLAFSKYLMEQEILERTKYWESKITNQKFSKYLSVKSIEEMRTNLYRSKKGVGIFGSDLMEQAFSVDFIFNSNKLEGSKVPLHKVREQVEKPAEKVSEEVRNTLKALHYVDSQVFTFNIRSIVELHKLLLGHEPTKSGLRKEVVVVHNAPVLEWEKIEKELKNLLMWYRKKQRSMYPPELAFDFYYHFERIHPFIDGNGRTGRLIINRILKDHRYHPMIVWNKNHEAHKTAFLKRMDGRDEDFYNFMAGQFVKTHKTYLEKLQKAIDANKLIGYFYSPSDA